MLSNLSSSGRGEGNWDGWGVAENLAQACLSPAGSAGISFSSRITKQKQLQIQCHVQPKQRLQTSSFQAMERLARTLFRSRPSFCPPLAVPLLPPSYKISSFLSFSLKNKKTSSGLSLQNQPDLSPSPEARPRRLLIPNSDILPARQLIPFRRTAPTKALSAQLNSAAR